MPLGKAGCGTSATDGDTSSAPTPQGPGTREVVAGGGTEIGSGPVGAPSAPENLPEARLTMGMEGFFFCVHPREPEGCMRWVPGAGATRHRGQMEPCGSARGVL